MTLKSTNRFVCLATFLLAIASVASASTSNPPATPATPKKAVAYGKLPMQFELNQGQADPRVKMLAHGQGYNILLQPTAATFDLRKTAKAGVQHETVRMAFAGASDQAALTAEQPLPGYVNYMRGSDRSKWQTGVATFARARVAAIYPGVDVVYYGTGRQLEFDLEVKPGANPNAIRLTMTGAKPVLKGNGELVLATAAGVRSDDVLLRKPVLYQMAGDRRDPVEGAFTVAANGEVGFRVGSYDHTRELVIDPIISYASYFGGSGDDTIYGTASNSSNQLYAVGATKSVDLPGTTGEYQAANTANLFNNNYPSAFVTKFSADGTAVLWTTYLGGTAGDTRGEAIAVSAADQAYITGFTQGTVSGFPITSNAVQPLGCPGGANSTGYGPVNEEISTGCGGEVFVSRFSSDGKTLLYSTYLGGASNYQDVGQAIALDAANNIYVAGYANSTGYEYAVSSNLSDQPSWPVNQHGVNAFGGSAYPTTPNAYMTAYAVTKATAIANGPDPNGNLGALSIQMAFVTEISADGSTLVYSSAIGGANVGGCGNGNCTTFATSVAPGKNGLIYVGGVTSSANFPVTANAFAPTCNTGNTSAAAGGVCYPTGWLAAFDTTKSGTASLAFSTYITGSTAGTDSNGNIIMPTSHVNSVAADASGNVVATGDVNANNFPTTSGSYQPACFTHGDGNGDSNVCGNGFVAKLTPTGNTVWSTYVHGTAAGGGVSGQGVTLDAAGNVYIVGVSTDPSFALVNPIVSSPAGQDALLLEFNPTASQLLMGTYLGAGGGISLDNNSLHLDSNLNAYFSGNQGVNPYGGTSLPVTQGAFSSTIHGNSDGFVAKMITQQQPSATALTVSPAATAKPTDTVTLTATVTTGSTLTGSSLPTGTVNFLNGTTAVGTGTLNAQGVATYSGTLGSGAYNITASYAGDAGFNGSVSSVAPTLTVTSAATTATTLIVVPANVTYGTAATLTATVMAGNSPATSGTVTFSAGSVSLGSANINASGIATLAVTPAVGVYSVVALYAGTGPTGVAPSTSAGALLTVTKAATSTALTSSLANAGTGANITLTATVSTATAGVTLPSGTVTFLSGTTSLGTGTVGTGGKATLVTSFSAANTYSLTAVYAGDTNYTGSTSPTLSQGVGTTSFTVLASPASLTIARGSSGTTTLTFTPIGGYSGVVSLACGTLPSKVTCTFSPTSVTLAGSPLTSTLTIDTGSLTAKLTTPTLKKAGQSEVFSASTALLPAMLLGLLLSFRRREFKKWTGLTVLFLVTSLGALTGLTAGCGSSSSQSNGANATPVGSYTIPVSVTGPQGAVQTVSLSVIVQ
ncbi:MAG: Ig-like domain repeat protein [Granulicella sp.]